MPIIYILKLEQNKYYVGRTGNYVNRIEQHVSGNGSEWTKKYKPIEVVETLNQHLDFTELAITLQYMKQYGIENVRGATYTNLFLSDKQKEEINQHIRGEYDLCLICGDGSHFASACTTNKPKSFSQRIKEWFCCFKQKTDYILFEKEENIVEFGKYKGLSFDDVRTKDKKYCNWVKNTSTTQPQFNKFKQWLNYCS